jgi:hypothetical protein
MPVAVELAMPVPELDAVEVGGDAVTRSGSPGRRM